MNSDSIYKTIALVYIGIVVALSIYLFYRDLAYTYLNLMLSESYSYLAIAVPISLVTILKLISSWFHVEGLNASRAVVSVSLLLTSVALYMFGGAVPHRYLEFKVLSILLLMWSLLLLFFRASGYAPLILSGITSLILVPLPGKSTYMMPIPTYLDKLIYSIISIAPLVGYTLLVLHGKGVHLSRTVAMVVSIAICSALLSIVCCRVFSEPVCSILLIIYATILSILYINHLVKGGKNSYMKRYSQPPVLFISSLATAIFMSLAFGALISVVYPALSIQTTPYVIDLPTALKNQNKTLQNFAYDAPKPILRFPVDALDIRCISLEYGGVAFIGYLEDSNSMDGFCNWYVCLAIQGYRIDKLWSEVANVTTNFIVVSNSNSRMLLGYTIYRLQPAGEFRYVRVTLVTSIDEDYLYQALQAKRLLNDIRVVRERATDTYLLTLPIALTNISTIIAIAVVSLNCFGKILHRKHIFSSLKQ